MRVDTIQLEQFRNYASFACSFDPNINVITGKNAQGKTNLLEALYYLAGARSFRTRKDAELIRFGENTAYIRAACLSFARELELEFRLARGIKKRILAGGVRKSAAELSGRLCAILFCPDDLELIRGGAKARRHMADLAICQLRPRYTEALAEFSRLYLHKTRILKDGREKKSLLDALDDFSLRMARAGTELIYYRAAWCAKLGAAAKSIHAEISGGENLCLRYRTVSNIEDVETRTRKEIYEALVQHYEGHRAAEIASGQCLSGPHKDEIDIQINGVPARDFASQGQARTAALSLKLAEREIAYADTGAYPLLLLDDVLSELDAYRQDFVLNRIAGGQVFITCCEGEEITKKTGARVLHIAGGALV